MPNQFAIIPPYVPKKGDKAYCNHTMALNHLADQNTDIWAHVGNDFEFEVYSVKGQQLLLRHLKTGYIAFYPHNAIGWIDFTPKYIPSNKIWRDLNV